MDLPFFSLRSDGFSIHKSIIDVHEIFFFGTRREREKKGGTVCVCFEGKIRRVTCVLQKFFLHQFAEKKLLPFLLNSIF